MFTGYINEQVVHQATHAALPYELVHEALHYIPAIAHGLYAAPLYLSSFSSFISLLSICVAGPSPWPMTHYIGKALDMKRVMTFGAYDILTPLKRGLTSSR